MNVRQWFFYSLVALFQIPFFTNAAGLVPCGGRGEPACQMCNVVGLVNNVNSWLVGVLSVVAAIMFIFAGFRILTARGNPTVVVQAKGLIINVAIGFIIVLGAWLMIDLLLKTLLSDDNARPGPWNTIACVTQPDPTTLSGNVDIIFPTPGQSRGTAFNSGQEFDPTAIVGIANLSATEADALVVQYGDEVGLDVTQVRNMQALMRVESGGCRNLRSTVGAIGCMQIMPGTAQQYDSSLQGLSQAQVEERLLDPEYNIRLGAMIYADLYNEFNQDERLVYAAYNGGPGALDPSNDCPGQMKYECVWDSPGCYDQNGPTGRTDCTPNTGYIETRNYVEKVSAVAREL